MTSSFNYLFFDWSCLTFGSLRYLALFVIVGILLIFGVFDSVIWANFVIFVIRLIFGVFHNVISDQGSRPPK